VDKSLASRDRILSRICGEYLEMPGLRLTRAQAQRLWGLDEQTCVQLLECLAEQRFLYRRADGTYVRLADGAVPNPPLRMVKADPMRTAVRASGRARSRP
jgi:hypothetical protein